jgi:hypothetical protein
VSRKTDAILIAEEVHPQMKRNEARSFQLKLELLVKSLKEGFWSIHQNGQVAYVLVDSYVIVVAIGS